MKTLDRTRPFAEYYPPIDGAWYEQDGRKFRMDGSLIDEPQITHSVEAEAAEALAEPEAPRRRGRPPKAREGE